MEFLTTPAEDTPEGRLLLNVSGVVAEFEREKIKERTLRGKREKARRGLVVASYPYGYKPDPAQPGKLIVHEPEAEIVRSIYKLNIDEGKSLEQIVVELRRLGVPARKGQWGTTQVARILTSDRYTGKVFYGQEQVVPGGKRKRGTDPIAVTIPAIVSPERLAAARAQLQKNRAVLVGRRANFSYLLSGLLRCAACGGRYQSEPSKGRRSYRHSRNRFAMHPCKGPSISAPKAEDAVWGAVSEALRNPETFREAAIRHEDSRGARDVELQSRVAHLQKQASHIRQQERRLIELVVGDLEQQEIVQGKLADLARQRRGFAEQLEAAEERAARHNAVTGLKNIQALCAQAAAGLDRLNDTGRRNVLLDLVEEIRVKQDRTLEIHGFLPGGEFSRPSSRSEKLPGLGYLLTVSAARQK
jgi:site-specific DNA recombinase